MGNNIEVCVAHWAHCVWRLFSQGLLCVSFPIGPQGSVLVMQRAVVRGLAWF